MQDHVFNGLSQTPEGPISYLANPFRKIIWHLAETAVKSRGVLSWFYQKDLFKRTAL